MSIYAIFRTRGMGLKETAVRESSKFKDELQAAMALLRGGSFGVDLQFKNFR